MGDLLTADGLARFSATAAAHVGDETVPGLVALVARGDQVHVEALGSLSVGGPAVQRDSLFRISSNSKPVTGAATLALVQEGLLDLDEPVARLLPELTAPRVLRRMDGPLDDTVPGRRPITVRDLLTFTFGFGLAVEMFAADPPWPVVAQAEALHLAGSPHIRRRGNWPQPSPSTTPRARPPSVSGCGQARPPSGTPPTWSARERQVAAPGRSRRTSDRGVPA